MKVHLRQIVVVTLWTLTVACVGLWHSQTVFSRWKEDSKSNFSKKLTQLKRQMQLFGGRCVSEPLQVRRALESTFELQVSWTIDVGSNNPAITQTNDTKNSSHDQISKSDNIEPKNRPALYGISPTVSDHPNGLLLFAELFIEINSNGNSQNSQFTIQKNRKYILRTRASQLQPYRSIDQIFDLTPYTLLWLLGTALATIEYIRQHRQLATAQSVLVEMNHQLVLQSEETPRLPTFARTNSPNLNSSTPDSINQGFASLDSVNLDTNNSNSPVSSASQFRKNRQLDSTQGLPDTIGKELMLLDSRLAETLSNASNSEHHLQRFESILESMREGVISVDRNLRLTAINPSAKELLDVRDATIGSLLIETIRDPRISEIVTSTLEGGLPRSAEFNLRQHPDRHVRATTSLLASPNELGVLLVIRNITQIVQLEQMRRDFTANVSHELKTPLAAIKAYTETLLLGAIDDAENNRRFLDQINSQAERLEALVSDLLELARVQQKSSFRSQKFELNDLIKSTVDSWQMIGRSRDVTVQTKLWPHEIQLTTDRESLSTILNNLISNAIRYTNGGGTVIVLSKTFSSLNSDNNHIRVTVRDTGIGIPKEDIERIFERFYRVEKARSVSLGGTGLGLSIVKNLVMVLGGKIKVNSEPNKGSEFILELPIEPKVTPNFSKTG